MARCPASITAASSSAPDGSSRQGKATLLLLGLLHGTTAFAKTLDPEEQPLRNSSGIRRIEHWSRSDGEGLSSPLACGLADRDQIQGCIDRDFAVSCLGDHESVPGHT